MVNKVYGHSWEEAVQWLKKQPDQQDLIKAAFYDDPLIDAAKRYAESSEWSAIQELLLNIEKGNVLDIGAGRGISSYALAKDGWKVTALEPDPSNIVGTGAIGLLAKESGLDIDVIETRGEGLPFTDGVFDLIYCRAALHHANNLNALCKEVFRVLKPGGIFLATREHVISKAEDLDKFLNAHPLHYLYGGEHAYLLKEYLSAIKTAGFKVEKVLAPVASDLNLYPQTKKEFKKHLASRLHIPNSLFPYFLLNLYAVFSNSPGRHYSFFARKHNA